VRALPAPREPIDLDAVRSLYPRLRQSTLATFDDCALAAYFDMRYAHGWSTHPQARGTIFHRFAAECLRTMREYNHDTIPPGEALVILYETLRQRQVPVEDIVRVPLREIKDLRMAALKFAKDNSFSVEKIVDIEQRLSAKIAYDGPGGEMIERELTGQLDTLIFAPPDGAIVLDWKDTWALPPEPRDAPKDDDDELKGISYHGYFQQRFYGWLVMRNYPRIQHVTLREFYARKTKVRKATLSRSKMADVEAELAILAEQFDLAVMSGPPAEPLELGRMGRWAPSPGKHCGFCLKPGRCPIDEDARVAVGGAATSEAQAIELAADAVLADTVRKNAITACKGWVETSGRPIPVRFSKGRRVLGWRQTRSGRRFEEYTPDASDRGGHPADADLVGAMREATARAVEARTSSTRPRRRRAAR
jgi:hypothetical protein